MAQSIGPSGVGSPYFPLVSVSQLENAVDQSALPPSSSCRGVCSCHLCTSRTGGVSERAVNATPCDPKLCLCDLKWKQFIEKLFFRKHSCLLQVSKTLCQQFYLLQLVKLNEKELGRGDVFFYYYYSRGGGNIVLVILRMLQNGEQRVHCSVVLTDVQFCTVQIPTCRHYRQK